MAMVNAGLCNNVLIWRAMNERSQYRFGQNPQQQQMSYQSGNGTGSLLWCVPYGAMTPASWGALQAARYMHKYGVTNRDRSEEHTSELQSLMRISYAVFCLKKKK